jgi:nucleoside-diphosphate-sugar epimerase
MSRRILLTGITGFIGRVLLSYLLKEDDVSLIVGVDNLSNSKFIKDDPLFQDPRIEMHFCSVQEYQPNYTFHEIWHLASPVGPVGVLKWAGVMGPMIIGDTAKMAELARRDGAKLLDISTSEVYGKDPNGIPQVEDLEKIVPANNTVRLEYGACKLACEVFLVNQVKSLELQCNIVRPYNIVSYGQQAAAGFVLPRFLEQALSGEPLTVYTPGTQRRTFTHVKDFVEGIIAVMLKGKNGEIYNIGNPANLYSIMHLAKEIVTKTKSNSRIDIVDPTTIHGPFFAEAWEKIPNISKIQKDTGWVPTRGLDNIIDEAILGYTSGRL